MRLNLYCLTLCFFFIGCVNENNSQENPDCQPIQGLDPYLVQGRVILLGEIHGTIEGPQFVERIACLALKKGLNVTVGLELPRSEEPVIDTFLESGGSVEERNKVLQLPFWSRDYQDGRASQAMFGLLDSIRELKSNGEHVAVVLIDKPNSSDRDYDMAQRIIEKIESNASDFFIVLTGNYHNRINEYSGNMGSYILKKFGEQRVLSLLQSYTGGSAWVDVAGEGFGPVRLGGHGRNEIGVFLDEGLGEYHGTLEMDSVHHSRPAKELLKN